MVWLGFELKMFAIVPLLIHDQSGLFLSKKTEIGVAFYYFIVQVIGRILFAWGSILGNAGILGVLGLLLKFGFLPFFWWVPSIFSRLDWFWIFVLSTLQKIPSFFVLRYTFDLNRKIIFFLCVLTLIIGVFGMYKNFFCLKNLMGWSSVTNGAVMLLLYSHSFYFRFIFFFLYRIVLSFCCWCFSKVEKNKIERFFVLTKVEFFYYFKGIFRLFYFSGLPPFISFWTKIYFFCVLRYKRSNLKLFYDSSFRKNVSYIFKIVLHLPFSGIEWFSSLIIVLLMFLQVIVYLSVFFTFFLQLHSRIESFFFSDLKISFLFPFFMKIFFIFLFPVFFWVYL